MGFTPAVYVTAAANVALGTALIAKGWILELAAARSELPGKSALKLCGPGNRRLVVKLALPEATEATPSTVAPS
jgi:hypothetical protein